MISSSIRVWTLVVVLATLTLAAEDLSSLVKDKCPNSGQPAAGCYAKLLTSVIQGISKGRTDLDIAPLDPLLTESLNLSVSAGADQYRMNFLEPRFAGMARVTVNTLKVGNPLYLTLQMPKLVMSSPYTNSGRIILIRASGGGAMTNTFEDAQITLKVTYGQETRDGRPYATVSATEVKFSAKKSKMHVDKLNSGNPVALELYNVFLSASGEEILKLMLPQLNEKFSEIFLDTAQRIVKNLPLDSVFSDLAA